MDVVQLHLHAGRVFAKRFIESDLEGVGAVAHAEIQEHGDGPLVEEQADQENLALLDAGACRLLNEHPLIRVLAHGAALQTLPTARLQAKELLKPGVERRLAVQNAALQASLFAEAL